LPPVRCSRLVLEDIYEHPADAVSPEVTTEARRSTGPEKGSTGSANRCANDPTDVMCGRSLNRKDLE